MERIVLVEGDSPVLIVAPHGPDDRNTDIIAEKIAIEFGAFAVINKGWRRSSKVDFANDLANCNDVRHIHSDVVKEEFLEPILRFKSRIRKKYDEKIFVLLIHGCSDDVRKVANNHDLDIILGYGEGNPPSYSCSEKFMNAFAHHLVNEGFGVYRGAAGGKYAGKAKNNLNQLFKRWYPDDFVESIQMEIVRDIRCNPDFIDLTISGIISAVDSMSVFDDTFNTDLTLESV